MSGAGAGRNGERLRAIVLRRTDYAEADRVLQLLQRRLPQNIKLRPKLLQKRLIPRGDLEA